MNKNFNTTNDLTDLSRMPGEIWRIVNCERVPENELECLSLKWHQIAIELQREPMDQDIRRLRFDTLCAEYIADGNYPSSRSSNGEREPLISIPSPDKSPDNANGEKKEIVHPESPRVEILMNPLPSIKRPLVLVDGQSFL